SASTECRLLEFVPGFGRFNSVDVSTAIDESPIRRRVKWTTSSRGHDILTSGLDNLVVADQKCNGFKSSSIAATEHLAKWARRFATTSNEHFQLEALASRTTWDRHPAQTRNV